MASFVALNPYNESHWADKVTDSGTTQLYALGQKRAFINSDGEWCEAVYAVNGEGSSAWDVTLTVEQKSGTFCSFVIGTNAGVAVPIGAPLSACAAGSYGWVQFKGPTSALVAPSAGFTVDLPLCIDADGKPVNATTGDGTSTKATNVFAIAQETATSGQSKQILLIGNGF